MKRKLSISDILAAALAALSAVLVIVAIIINRTPGDTGAAARRVERIVTSRMHRLEKYVEAPPARLPDDMVIYRYRDDTLSSWTNQFPVCNDDLNTGLMFHRITNPRAHMHAPLSDVTDSVAFHNFGTRWYLSKRIVQSHDETVIIGLEVRNSLDKNSDNGVSPRLRLSDSFVIRPLDYGVGSTVSVDGTPVFKVLYETLEKSASSDAFLIWLAYAFLLAACSIFLSRHRSFRGFLMMLPFLLLSSAAMYAWGVSVRNELTFFSPLLFAGGPLLPSLGSVVIVNTVILLVSSWLFLVRKDIYRRIGHSRPAIIFSSLMLVLAVAGILVYTHFTLRSIVLNSNITLELYKFGLVNAWTVVVYVSFIAMLTSIPMLLTFLEAAVSRLFGVRIHVFSRGARVVFAILTGVYFMLLSSNLGFRKEQDRVELWANRLSIDRDISLEMQLRRAEGRIASDVFIGPLAAFDNASMMIRNRIADTYLQRVAQDCDITVYLFNDTSRQPQLTQFINERIADGVPIAEGSCFQYSNSGGGRFRYDGIFFYYVTGAGMVSMLVEVEPRSMSERNGYSALIGDMSRQGSVSMPNFYSYARYKGRDLQEVRGNYAYPTRMPDADYERIYASGRSNVDMDGYTHFANVVTEDEAVVISRPDSKVSNYLIEAILITLLAFLFYSVPTLSLRRRDEALGKSYYRTRITWVLEISLILTLVVMALVSIVFVNRRNEANLQTIMSDKVSSVQSMVQKNIKGARTTADVQNQDMLTLLNEVASNINGDITLYDPSGKVIMSTTPEVFDRHIMGCRVNAEAYGMIMHKCRRFFVHRERIGQRSVYCMYAPLMGEEGQVLGILCSPYTGGESYDFERDAVKHFITMLTVFLLLFIFARFATGRIVSRLFRPLSEMGRKMNAAGLDNLQYIEYDRDDEISSLVQAYNRMVTELSESTRQLAQAERDKAWSGMARQVAHEIKNPLTPMKLQLQRIIRLKQRNVPDWEDKFDEVAKVLLDHIDILTDTANEFSTFAKLYTEEPTSINLDALLQEEISMFDNRDNIRFDYMGLDAVEVMGPKPQLTRVFVNLIGNAVQAIGDAPDGRVVVSLRHSSRDGFYDIVVEDNGPGVSPENVEKLFTPNFTTKTGGSGLGLAISRSILERCGATISYSRSFALDGACFTVQYPRH